MGLTLGVIVVSAGLFVDGVSYFTQGVSRIDIYTFALPPEVGVRCVGMNAGASLLFLQTLIKGQACGGAFLFNPPLWSVCIEVMLYILFPALLRAVVRLKGVLILCVLMSVVLVLDVLWVQVSVDPLDANHWPQVVWSVYFNPVGRFLEFMLGMFLARLWKTTQGLQTHAWSVSVLMALSLVWSESVWLQYGYTTAYWTTSTGMAWAFFGFLVLLQLSRLRLLRRSPFTAWCASVSYMVYCVHWPLLEIYAWLGAKRFMSEHIGAWGSLCFALGLILIISHALVSRLEPLWLAWLPRLFPSKVYTK